MSTSETHRPAIAECFDILRPAKPTMTMPASGNVSGSHGERLSALRGRLPPWTLGLGPLVEMVRVTVWGPVAPVAIGLAEQVTVASGRPLQAKVTAEANVPPVGVTLKVEVVNPT